MYCKWTWSVDISHLDQVFKAVEKSQLCSHNKTSLSSSISLKPTTGTVKPKANKHFLWISHDMFPKLILQVMRSMLLGISQFNQPPLADQEIQLSKNWCHHPLRLCMAQLGVIGRWGWTQCLSLWFCYLLKDLSVQGFQILDKWGWWISVQTSWKH